LPLDEDFFTDVLAFLSGLDFEGIRPY